MHYLKNTEVRQERKRREKNKIKNKNENKNKNNLNKNKKIVRRNEQILRARIKIFEKASSRVMFTLVVYICKLFPLSFFVPFPNFVHNFRFSTYH